MYLKCGFYTLKDRFVYTMKGQYCQGLNHSVSKSNSIAFLYMNTIKALKLQPYFEFQCLR